MDVLTSDRTSFMTGSELLVDVGWSRPSQGTRPAVERSLVNPLPRTGSR